ncbi:hypothetical protein QPL79_01430 [Ignisphaera sp. 4213-co]|uniref:Uncharacterized protein n=1 Tax=Ignisphaera cupida TaxID=3050454 RepID=A0ABD4Z3Y1_9CREN|nr:hypothetical protein [Ignisphaera sp. 4213-co]MDK6028027.1 hypothetical protein [Ignisphaera sp. 4213-co]
MNRVKLIVIGSKVDDFEKCGRVATKIRKSLAKYTEVEILFVNASSSGLSLDGEEIIPCELEDEAMDYIISKIASDNKNILTQGIVVAAAIFKTLKH